VYVTTVQVVHFFSFIWASQFFSHRPDKFILSRGRPTPRACAFAQFPWNGPIDGRQRVTCVLPSIKRDAIMPFPPAWFCLKFDQIIAIKEVKGRLFLSETWSQLSTYIAKYV
jgi:hypothetical protein